MFIILAIASALCSVAFIVIGVRSYLLSNTFGYSNSSGSFELISSGGNLEIALSRTGYTHSHHFYHYEFPDRWNGRNSMFSIQFKRNDMHVRVPQWLAVVTFASCSILCFRLARRRIKPESGFPISTLNVVALKERNDGDEPGKHREREKGGIHRS